LGKEVTQDRIKFSSFIIYSINTIIRRLFTIATGTLLQL